MGSFGVQPQLSTTSTKPASFGQPGPAMKGFSAAPSVPCVEPEKPESVERSLEVLYREYPDKTLRGLEKEHLQPAFMVLGQVAQEVALAWIQAWCPLMNWDKVLSSVARHAAEAKRSDGGDEDPSSATNASKTVEKGKDNLYLVPEEALHPASRVSMQTVVDLLQRCAGSSPGPRAESLLGLIKIVDDCEGLCLVLRDHRRAALLGQTRKAIQWVNLKLDCRKFEIHQAAADHLRATNARYEEKLATLSASEAARPRKRRRRAERGILDRATAAFERHRKASCIDLLRALDELLRLSAADSGQSDEPTA